MNHTTKGTNYHQLDHHCIFHSAIIIMSGPNAGVSCIMVPYDQPNPACREIQVFAKHTLANLAAFFYHWWTKESKFHESTVKQLMKSFYFDRFAIAVRSLWDPLLMRATSTYSTPGDTWLDDNADLDLGGASNIMVTYGASNEDSVQVEL